MRKSMFVFLFFPVVLRLWSQSNDVFNYPLAAGTLQRYNAICGQLASRPYTKGAFEQTRTIQRLNRSLVSKGDFIIASESGLVWITKSPFPSVTVLGKDYIIQSTPDGTESRLNATANETFAAMAQTLGSLFTGNVQVLQAKFDNYFTETQAQGAKAWTVGLVPKDQSIRSYARQFILEGTEGPAGALIRSLIIREESGDSVTYIFSQHTFPADLEAHEKAYFTR